MFRSRLSLIAPAATAILLSTASAFGAGTHTTGHGHFGHGDEAIGAPGDPAKATRTIEIRMGDMFFSTKDIHVEPGETVRFVLVNEGEAVHEFNIGTAEMHAEHAHEMMEMMESGMLTVDRINHGMEAAMSHDDPNSVLVEPGKTGEVTWTFGEAGDLEFSCNVPGHRENGMFGKFEVGH